MNQNNKEINFSNQMAKAKAYVDMCVKANEEMKNYAECRPINQSDIDDLVKMLDCVPDAGMFAKVI
jgi:hypothetical protein